MIEVFIIDQLLLQRVASFIFLNSSTITCKLILSGKISQISFYHILIIICIMQRSATYLSKLTHFKLLNLQNNQAIRILITTPKMKPLITTTSLLFFSFPQIHSFLNTPSLKPTRFSEFHAKDIFSNQITLSSKSETVHLCRSQNVFKQKSYRPLPQCSLSTKQLLSLGIFRPGSVVRFQNESILPTWADIALVVRGQQFAMNNLFTTSLSYIFGLTLLLSIPPVADDLLLSGNSDNPEKSANRYAATVVQVFLWMRRALSDSKNGAQTDPRLLEQDSDNWVLESLRNVRFLHLNAATRIHLKRSSSSLRNSSHPINNEFWDAFQRDLESSHIPQRLRVMHPALRNITQDSIPLNQFSFSMTLFAFMGLTIIRSKELYANDIHLKDQDIMAFVHMWAVYGHALGIEDEFNIALQPDLPTLRNRLEEIFQAYYIPSLFNLNHGSKLLIEAFLEGLTQIITGADPETIVRQCLKLLLRISTPHLDRRRTPIGLKYDSLMDLGRGPAALLPEWVPISSPLISLYHFKIGFQFFKNAYSSDENISRQCFYYQ